MHTQMKLSQRSMILTGLACGFFMAGFSMSVWAADDDKGTSDNQFIEAQASSQTLASSIMDMDLKNGSSDDAKSIGTVNDLILDDKQHLAGVVVGVGGFLGIGQKNVGIAWNAIKDINREDKVAVVDFDKDALEKAPEFKTQKKQKQEQEAKEQQQQAQQQQQQMQDSPNQDQ